MLETQETSEAVETQTESATVGNEQSSQENDAEVVEKELFQRIDLSKYTHKRSNKSVRLLS